MSFLKWKFVVAYEAVGISRIFQSTYIGQLNGQWAILLRHSLGWAQCAYASCTLPNVPQS